VKHTILIVTLHSNRLIPLLEVMEDMLHKSYKKYIKAFTLEFAHKPGQLVTSGKPEAEGIDWLVNRVEEDLKVEKYGAQLGHEVEVFHSAANDFRIVSQSTVADLLVVEVQGYAQYANESGLWPLIKSVSCPVLLLPQSVNVQCHVAVHAAGQCSVHMMKSFIKLFGTHYRELPLSLLMTEPDSTLQMESERVFINYLQMYFQNLGAQHVYDDIANSLFDYVSRECNSPLLLVDQQVGKVLIDQPEANRVLIDHPIFIYKD